MSAAQGSVATSATWSPFYLFIYPNSTLNPVGITAVQGIYTFASPPVLYAVAAAVRSRRRTRLERGTGPGTREAETRWLARGEAGNWARNMRSRHDDTRGGRRKTGPGTREADTMTREGGGGKGGQERWKPTASEFGTL